jgi:hypothetical protein
MERVEYKQVPGNIHCFRLNKSDRSAADQFVEKFTAIYDEAIKPGYMLVLIDLRPEGLPPISYTLNKLRLMFKDLDRSPALYGAYLYEQSMVMGLLSTFLDTLRGVNSKRKLFKGDAEEAALAWLREQAEAHEHTEP